MEKINYYRKLNNCIYIYDIYIKLNLKNSIYYNSKLNIIMIFYFQVGLDLLVIYNILNYIYEYSNNLLESRILKKKINKINFYKCEILQNKNQYGFYYYYLINNLNMIIYIKNILYNFNLKDNQISGNFIDIVLFFNILCNKGYYLYNLGNYISNIKFKFNLNIELLISELLSFNNIYNIYLLYFSCIGLYINLVVIEK